MLDPKNRELYLKALWPPGGYTFDRAIGTTFTLDLSTLLAIPLSFAQFELNTKDELFKDPISVLEALRRLAGKFHIFCQNGQIKIPSINSPLFSYLEKTIIEASPPHPEGIFHPKIWVLRFISESGQKVFYRFLCLSRNITFDKSWDTILTLEGVVKGSFYARNRALSDFIKTLPSLAKKKLRKQIMSEINKIAEEVRHVNFKASEEFYEDFHFWPMGIPGYQGLPIQENYWRILVVSPFLTNDILNRLSGKRKENLIISRIDELNELKPEILEKFKNVFYIDEDAYDYDDVEDEISAAKPQNESVESTLSGLHAKFYLADYGWDAAIWTGSANATNAAFDGLNVEFMVELRGKKSRIGIDKLLAEKDKVVMFKNLLRDYQPEEVKIPEEERIRKKLDRHLDKIRRQIANANIHTEVIPSKSKNLFDLKMYFPSGFKLPVDYELQGKCWPISIKSGLSQNLSFPKLFPSLVFQHIVTEKITSFFAFEISVKQKSIRHSIRFVLNLPLRGLPPKRDEKILQTIVSDRESFIRYLLLLLNEGEPTFLFQDLGKRQKRSEAGEIQFFPYEDIPLFEDLVRAFSRSPEKIKRISKLIEDISKTEGGEELLPEGFKELWQTFKRAEKILR